jgi:flagellar biosynthesis protein FlhA
MPNLAFLGLAAASGGGAWFIAKRHQKQEIAKVEAPLPPEVTEARDLSWEDVPPVDAIGLEIGYRLIPMVDKAQGGELLARLKGVRKKLSQELGFLIPAVHIRDNLDLAPAAYRITLLGATMSQDEVQVDRELAINPGQVYGQLDGSPARDPVFGLQAVWIQPSQREQAQTFGYTVVDVSTVIATHLSQTLHEHAHELLGHEEAQQLLDRLAEGNAKLVETLVPKVLPLGAVVKVLQNLLRENIPIRDLRTIVEVMAEHASKSQNPVSLTAAVRIALGRTIFQKINGLDDELPVVTLDHSLEQILLKSVQAMAEGSVVMEPGLANQMLKALRETSERQELAGQPTVLLVPDNLREFLARFVRHRISNIHVLAFSEIPDNKQVKIIATVGGGAKAATGVQQT